MMNAYGFDKKIHFPENPYDGYIYISININAVGNILKIHKCGQT